MRSIYVLEDWRLEEDNYRFKVSGYNKELQKRVTITSKSKNETCEIEDIFAKMFLETILNAPIIYDLLIKSYYRIEELSNKQKYEQINTLLNKISNSNIDIETINTYDDLQYYLRNRSDYNYKLLDLSKPSNLEKYLELIDDANFILTTFSMNNINNKEISTNMSLIYYYFEMVSLLIEIKETLSKEDILRLEIEKFIN